MCRKLIEGDGKKGRRGGRRRREGEREGGREGREEGMGGRDKSEVEK